jgi:hypothetical protein
MFNVTIDVRNGLLKKSAGRFVLQTTVVLPKRGFFRTGKAVEGLGGGVAVLRRTILFENWTAEAPEG